MAALNIYSIGAWSKCYYSVIYKGCFYKRIFARISFSDCLHQTADRHIALRGTADTTPLCIYRNVLKRCCCGGNSLIFSSFRSVL